MPKEDGQFKSGSNWSGNTKGRPTKENTYSDTLRAILEAKEINVTYTYTCTDGTEKKETVQVTADKNMYYGIAAAQIREALAGSVQAQKEIVDRIQGKAPQTLNVKEDIEDLDDKLRRACDLMDKLDKDNIVKPNNTDTV